MNTTYYVLLCPAQAAASCSWSMLPPRWAAGHAACRSWPTRCGGVLQTAASSTGAAWWTGGHDLGAGWASGALREWVGLPVVVIHCVADSPEGEASLDWFAENSPRAF
jgi:hypothetical protein